jgi:thioredoxin 1
MYLIWAQIRKKQELEMATKNISDSTFDSDVLQAGVPVLVDFWAEWCGPCKAIGPKLDEIAEELGEKVVIAKLNIDENPDSPTKYGVRGIPTLILFKDGNQVDQIVGNHPKENIKSVIEKYL